MVYIGVIWEVVGVVFLYKELVKESCFIVGLFGSIENCLVWCVECVKFLFDYLEGCFLVDRFVVCIVSL